MEGRGDWKAASSRDGRILTMKVAVYKSVKHKDLFLFVNETEGFERVPEELLKKFDDPQLALTFELDVNRTLAQEDPAVVLVNLGKSGYHLQLPPLEAIE